MEGWNRERIMQECDEIQWNLDFEQGIGEDWFWGFAKEKNKFLRMQSNLDFKQDIGGQWFWGLQMKRMSFWECS